MTKPYANYPKTLDRIHVLEMQSDLQAAEIQVLSMEIQQLRIELLKLQQKQGLDGK